MAVMDGSGFISPQVDDEHAISPAEAVPYPQAEEGMALPPLRRDDRSSSRLRPAGDWANALIGLIAVVGLIGWLAGLPQISSLGTASPPIQPTSVVALALMAVALRALRTTTGVTRQWTMGTAAVGVIVMAIGVLAANLGGPTFLAGIGLTFDSLPTSVGSASCYLMIGVALLLAVSDRQPDWDLAQCLAVAVAGVVVVSMLGVSWLPHRIDLATSSLRMVPLVAIVLLAASFCLLVMRPTPRLRQLIRRDPFGGLFVRCVLPLAVAVSMLVVWSQANELRAGWFGTVAGQRVLGVVVFVGALALLARLAVHLNLSLERIADGLVMLGERIRAFDPAMTAPHESVSLLRTIFASTPGLIVAKSSDGRILMLNPAAMAALGVGQEAIGRTEEELFGATDEVRRFTNSDRRVIDTGQAAVVEEHRALPDGLRTFLVTKAPLHDPKGGDAGLVAIAQDITEIKRALQDLELLLVAEHRLRGDAEQATRAKDEFLAIVSHELRSPLNAIKGWSQVLTDTRPPEPALVMRAAEAIKRNIDHQTRLIEDLLDTSHIISGKLELRVSPVNLVDVVHTVLDLWQSAVREKQIHLSFACSDEEVFVDGDFDRLQQVLSNLLSNGIKFTPQGGCVRIGLLQKTRGVELSVTDDGIGIRPDFLPHVFDRFSQADTSMTRRYMGLGIGLALVRNLVELHGGTVEATSAGEGRGARFTVRLPPARQPAPRNAGVPCPAGATGITLAGLTVWVVDDDADSRESLRLMLEQAGAQVRCFDSGEALRNRPDPELPPPGRLAVVLDIAMPGVSGFEVLRRIRRDERTASVPVVAVTAFTRVDDARFLGAGFNGKLGKPVDAQALIGLLAALAGCGGGSGD